MPQVAAWFVHETPIQGVWVADPITRTEQIVIGLPDISKITGGQLRVRTTQNPAGSVPGSAPWCNGLSTTGEPAKDLTRDCTVRRGHRRVSGARRYVATGATNLRGCFGAVVIPDPPILGGRAWDKRLADNDREAAACERMDCPGTNLGISSPSFCCSPRTRGRIWLPRAPQEFGEADQP